MIGRSVRRSFRKHETHPFDAGWVVVELRFHANALRRACATTEGVHGLMSHERLGYALPHRAGNGAWDDFWR